MIAQISRINELIIEEPQSWKQAVGNRNQGRMELNPEECEVATSMVLLVLRHGDMAFYRYERGVLSEQRLESALAVLINNLCAPVFRKVWSTFGLFFVSAYRSYIDAKTAECQ